MTFRLFAFWIDGLAGAWLAAENWLRRPQRFRLRMGPGTVTLEAVAAAAAKPLAAIDGDAFEKWPDKVLEQTRGGIIEIVVPAAAIMERQLHALPAESLPFIDKVVLHQVETLFPWRADDILHSVLVDQRAGGAVDVSVRATARSAIAPVLAMAEASGAAEIVVVGDGDAGDRPEAGIVAATASAHDKKLNSARVVARYSVLALLAFSGCAIGWTTYSYWSWSSDVAALDQEIAGRRQIIQRIAEASDAGRNRSLEVKKRHTPVAVLVLNELSALLPDTTYLTDLNLEAERVRISGVSANAAELVPLLEGSGHFRNATFFAPTTRLAGRSLDHFAIEATVVPESKASR